MGIRSQNNSDQDFFDRFQGSSTLGGPEPGFGSPTGMTASGGVISDYISGTDVYRAHIFNGSGDFVVSAPGSEGDTVDILLVAGGGGSGRVSGNEVFGGGGAGGMIEHTNISIPSTPITCPITVGAGGALAQETSTLLYAGNGGDSSFTLPTGPTVYTAAGGGGGGSSNGAARPGGSGAGRSGGSGSGGDGNVFGPTSPLSGTPAPGQGYPGGSGVSGDNGGAGGGGAGGAGVPGDSATYPTTYKQGGPGRASVYAYGPTNPITYAGGGAAEAATSYAVAQAPGGGGYHEPTFPVRSNTMNGVAGLGGGGAGGLKNSPRAPGGSGGSGTVVVRYKIGRLTSERKATGGAVNYTPTHTVHVFTNSGTFTSPASFSETVEYVVVGGGGGGGKTASSSAQGGGGGAGGFRTGSTPLSGAQNITVLVGGGGRQSVDRPDDTDDYSQLGGNGGTSQFGPTIDAPGGGGGSTGGGLPGGVGVAGDGASSGGGGYPSSADHGAASGSPFPGTLGPSEPSTAGYWGHTGGGYPMDSVYGSGGGGATSEGENSPGWGGMAIQVPATFRYTPLGIGYPGPTGPSITGADTSGLYWFAGGGSARGNTNGGGSAPSTGPAASRLGAPHGGSGSSSPTTYDAKVNSGSGGAGGSTTAPKRGGAGGSGIVIIAYPT